MYSFFQGGNREVEDGNREVEDGRRQLLASPVPRRLPHGRATYPFQIPLQTEDPNYAISLYVHRDPLDEARAVIGHYEESQGICGDIGQALIECRQQLGLERSNTEITNLIATMRDNDTVDVRTIGSINGQGPPQVVVFTENLVPRRINAASQSLNVALRLSFSFLNDEERHAATHTNLSTVQRSRYSGRYMEESITKLEVMVLFIDDLRKQARKFIEDFLYVAASTPHYT